MNSLPSIRLPTRENGSTDLNGNGSTEKKPDAGMRNLDHYASKLPRYRYNLRQYLIPVVRLETPYLAFLQDSFRSSALDSYFALTANLGTHTFFMITLPILFWCGYSDIGRAMVNMLGFGVYWSGFVKDALCIPRPLSPPLQRITMSGSAALEYGFPSTHSTNAVSVALYAIHRLGTIEEADRSPFHTASVALFYFYAVSIVAGRLYCGMHGFVDVIVGSALGAAIGVAQIYHGDRVYAWLCDGNYMHMLIVFLTMVVLVRVHPEPADDCPCFDDSVSFAGVEVGCMFGAWTYTGSKFAWETPVPGTVPFDLQKLGYLKAALRIILGVLIVFVWRGVAKPLCLNYLPRLFRRLESLDLSLPRKWELRASQYTHVPPLRRDDNVLPSASEIPSLVANFRNPRRRAISVGPQSAADAYETLAYRQKRRRESRSSASPEPAGSRSPQQSSPSPTAHGESTGLSVMTGGDAPQSEPSPTVGLKGRIRSFELMMGQGEADVVVDEGNDVVGVESEGRVEGVSGVPDEHEERDIFRKLEKPRVRYDVEVVTKLIVYWGIGLLAVELNPILFELCGLGMS